MPPEAPYRTLNVGLLAPGEVFGGAERQMVTLCAWLTAQGVVPSVMLFHDGTLASVLRTQGIVPSLLGGRSGFSLRAVRRLREDLKRKEINVLHFHGYKAAVHAWLAARGCELAIVKTEHGATEVQNDSLRERAKTALYRFMDTSATRRCAARIVYVTKDLEKFFADAHTGLERSVIYNGIERTSLVGLSRPPEYEPARRNVLILGRLEAVKGIEYAIRAQLTESMPANVLLHIVGDGPLRESLADLTQQLGLTDKVAFHGFRQNAQDYLAHADALLMPSMHEGLPYVLLEAMSQGVPCVVTRVGGLKEVLSDGDTALLIPPADPRAIAEGLRRLLTQPSLAARLRENASRLVETQFTAATMGQAYLNLYRAALSTGPGCAERS